MKLYMFWTVPLSIIRSFSPYTQQQYMSYKFAVSLLASCQQTCMIYTVAVCTVKNSWWWTDELSEHVEFHSRNKFDNLVHLVGFIIRNFITMHGHMSVFQSPPPALYHLNKWQCH